MTGHDENSARHALKVGNWRVHPRRNEISRDGEALRLEPKVIEVLVYLAQSAGQVVGREELLSAVWPGVVVGDDALTQAIIKLRKALGDDAHLPTYIETISKRGYRLIAPVESATEFKAPAALVPTSLLRRRLIAIAIAGGVLLGALGAWVASWRSADRGAATSPPIIAVLPLSNLTGDAKREYFSDGITEDIINALGRFSGLRVISRNSVESFKTRSMSAPAIGSELGARYVVEGSVREAEGKLRVAVELSDAEKGIVLWSDRYDGEGSDVFEIQDRIVKNIVGLLAVKVTRLEQERAASKHPENLAAYDLVLRARALLLRSDRVANREARALLAKARDLAPGYAEAYVVSAMAEWERATYGWIEDPTEGILRAEQYLRRALAIDDSGANARAHGQLGLLYVALEKFDEALEEADRAIELNPSDAFAHDTRGATLLWLGRVEEAIASVETALRFNPAGRSSGTGLYRSLGYYLLGRYREALAAADAAIVRYPDAPFLHAIRAATLAQMGHTEAAQAAAARLRRLDPFFLSAQFGSGFINPEHYAHVQEGLRKAGL